ncbi:MAG TPA: PEMT/PEM2 methyltransferase family protein [Gemmatimonadales bacterium]
MTAWGFAALGYQIASRAAYVIPVGLVLAREARRPDSERKDLGACEARYQHFRRWASVMMNHDAFALILLSVVTRHTLQAGTTGNAVMLGVGGALVVIGLGIKGWAAARLGSEAYYWRNFFVPMPRTAPDPPGPYRYLQNPMYTVGYAQAYGLALVLRSWPGLLGAAVAQGAILVFHLLVEKPHYQALQAGEPGLAAEARGR